MKPTYVVSCRYRPRNVQPPDPKNPLGVSEFEGMKVKGRTDTPGAANKQLRTVQVHCHTAAEAFTILLARASMSQQRTVASSEPETIKLSLSMGRNTR